ncbi:MAG: glycosyltransferase [Deltaproteobacteria bacterium]|nr:glycosyltransferase [bacterium]MCB9477000.1 glycosyltransferase [Deltaproteobacteria bacterium]MCB9490143.1 glycosyltransferase [Deltaproteobacteria bacterium]
MYPTDNVVIVIPCAGERVTQETISAALTQRPGVRVILSGARPADLRDQPGLTIFDTGAPVPPGMARNMGLQLAGEFDVAVFLDADCVPAHGWLKALLARVAEGHELVGGVMRPIDGGYWHTADQVTGFFDQLEGHPGGEVETLTATNLAVTRRLWETAGPYPDKNRAGEDFEFVLRCKAAGVTPYLEPAARITHKPIPVGPGGLWRRAGLWGFHSIQVRKRLPELSATPRAMLNPFVLAFGAPLIGAIFAVHQLRHTPIAYRRWRLWPAMAIAKTNWCLGAASSLFRGAE